MHIEHDIGRSIDAPRLGGGSDTGIDVAVQFGRGPEVLPSSSVRRGSV